MCHGVMYPFIRMNNNPKGRWNESRDNFLYGKYLLFLIGWKKKNVKSLATDLVEFKLIIYNNHAHFAYRRSPSVIILIGF